MKIGWNFLPVSMNPSLNKRNSLNCGSYTAALGDSVHCPEKSFAPPTNKAFLASVSQKALLREIPSPGKEIPVQG